jgi:hypothetical protein
MLSMELQYSQASERINAARHDAEAQSVIEEKLDKNKASQSRERSIVRKMEQFTFKVRRSSIVLSLHITARG